MSAPRRAFALTSVLRRTAVLGLAALVLTACGPTGQIVDAGAAPTRQPAEPSPAASPPAPVVTPSPPVSDATPPDDDGDEPAAPEHTTVSVYFTRGERVEAVTRVVPRVPRIGSAAIEQLLGGPAASERAAGYGTQIPDGTRLRGLTIADGVAVVDLSREFESGGGTLGLTLRLGQVACTLDAFPTVDGVRFALDGEVVDVFSGDGLVVDEPVACADYTRIAGAGRPSPAPTADPSE